MNSDRHRRNDDVYAEHKAAVAAGEKRVLRNTSTGDLHSYPADEIGFTPGGGQAQVSTWWGMGILAVVAAVLTVFSVVLLLAPLGQGQSPMWGALFLTAGGGAFTFYAVTLSRQEYRATQLRKLRGSPKPSSTGRADYWEPVVPPVEPPTDGKNKVKSLDDYLYDIHKRPSNGTLRFWIGFQLVILGALGYVIPLFSLHWMGVRQWALVFIPLICAAALVWWFVRFMSRRGGRTKAQYRAYGGDPAGTSDLLFGQVTYEITPDGRWKWPTPSSGD
ncbi:UNVERIFIED_CONTAM: hypothetical protein ABIE34_003400 [Jeotgalibacillus campisalis]